MLKCLILLMPIKGSGGFSSSQLGTGADAGCGQYLTMKGTDSRSSDDHPMLLSMCRVSRRGRSSRQSTNSSSNPFSKFP